MSIPAPTGLIRIERPPRGTPNPDGRDPWDDTPPPSIETATVIYEHVPAVIVIPRLGGESTRDGGQRSLAKTQLTCDLIPNARASDLVVDEISGQRWRMEWLTHNQPVGEMADLAHSRSSLIAVTGEASPL